MATVSIVFEPNIYKIIEQFSVFETVLHENLRGATEASALLLADIALNYAVPQFKNPHGAFEGSMQTIVDDPYLARIGSDLPYARRLEWGFHGADSLGRVYDQEGYLFMSMTIDDRDIQEAVGNNYMQAVQTAWNEVIGNAAGMIEVAGAVTL